MAAAIGHYVAWRMAGGEVEPVAERRRRKVAFDALAADAAIIRPDFRNSPATAEDADRLESDHDYEERPSADEAYALSDDTAGVYFDDRTRA
jgi:hypothetical protein